MANKDSVYAEGAQHVELAEADEITKANVDKFGSYAKIDSVEIKLVRKLDMWIMPTLWVMYFLNFLDRNAMINGKLDTLVQDLTLVDSQYNTCVSILLVGYLGGQIPPNMLLSRVCPSWYMSGFMTAWSLVSLLTYMAHDYHTMLVMLYTRKEIATRISIFYTGTMAASAFAGMISAPIFSHLGGVNGLSGSQCKLFIIQGAVSLLAAIFSLVLLPDTPKRTWWLTAEERVLAATRTVRDATNRREAATRVWTGLWEACADPLPWIFCLMDCLHLSANGFKNFVPTLVKEVGFETTTALLLTCPPYVLAAFVTILVGWNSGQVNERTWHITISKLVAIAGFTICVATLNTWARYFGAMVFVSASYGVNTIILGWVSSVLGQSDEKKAVALAMCNTFGNLSAVYTPYLWPDSAAPRFATAMASSIAFSAGVIACGWVLRFTIARANRRLREEDPETTNFYVY
ncbi:major facilitator superfamily domain-containing protein [Aspergillus karnatakaensis]|uniref:major facilitator superfamily domain-containing protein n=1 Tax=Aspergillus karnatakaensis TaxID=1810916 RepID=UPI003CCD2C1F